MSDKPRCPLKGEKANESWPGLLYPCLLPEGHEGLCRWKVSGPTTQCYCGEPIVWNNDLDRWTHLDGRVKCWPEQADRPGQGEGWNADPEVSPSGSDRCPCGMRLKPEEGQPTPFTLEWHIAHRERHLAVFPQVDEGTRRNLDLFVEWAS